MSRAMGYRHYCRDCSIWPTSNFDSSPTRPKELRVAQTLRILPRRPQSVRHLVSRLVLLLLTVVVLVPTFGVHPALAYWIYPETTYKNGDATKNVWYTNCVTKTRIKEALDVASFYTQFGTVTVHISLNNGNEVTAQSSIVWNHPESNVLSKCKFSGTASGPIPILCKYTRQIWIN